ncbi:MAG: hypothetical protein U1A77_16045 [Pirellulales bacterium]
MRKHVLSMACFGTLLFGAACGLALSSAQQPATPQPTAKQPAQPPAATPQPAAARGDQELVVEKLRPTWRVGDRWVIETQTQPVQRREAIAKDAPAAKPLTWRFTVQAEEQVAQRPCFRVLIECVDVNVQAPVTRLWVDRESYALRQIQTQQTIAGEVRTMTESYEFPTGQPSPVVVATSVVLPVDLPVFQQADTKGSKTFEFEAIQGAAGVKALDDLSFSYSIEQNVNSAQEDQVKGLLHEEFTKTLTREPIANVQLSAGQRKVRQLWQANLPWPAFSDNGVTRSRLVKVEPAGNR